MICEYRDIDEIIDSATKIMIQDGNCDGVNCKKCMFSRHNVIDCEYEYDCFTIIKYLAKKYSNEKDEIDISAYKLACIFLNCIYGEEVVNLEEE